MEKEKINQFIMVNGKFFPEMMIEDVKQKLESLDESKESMLMATEWKNPTVAFLFAFFLGGLGIDRFWLGETGLGVVKLITCAGAGIWGLIDLFTVMNRAKMYNYNKLMMYF
jgi:TM2 domain-containing membrane protein YozV